MGEKLFKALSIVESVLVVSITQKVSVYKYKNQ